MIINIKKIKYIINDKILFDDISIDIKENTITTISGKNNCGKTTLFRILGEPNSYDISIDGKEKSSYSQEELDNIIQAVFPLKTFFKEKKVIDEITRNAKCKKENILFILGELNLSSQKTIETLTPKEIIKLQIAKAIALSEKIVLIDEIDKYFTSMEVKELLLLFKECINKFNQTYIVSTTSLDNAIYTDELFIINEGKIILSGDPIEVLEKDNIINKAGLKIPFMIDLSVKLKDYDLISKIELNKEKLINSLWK